MPYVVPVPQAARVFAASGAVQDDAVEQQLRRLGEEVVRVAERFTRDPSLHRQVECDDAATASAKHDGSRADGWTRRLGAARHLRALRLRQSEPRRAIDQCANVNLARERQIPGQVAPVPPR